MSETTELQVANNSGVMGFRQATDAASLCKSIVTATAMKIGGRSYVRVEGWQAIAIAHGCVAQARAVERIEGGVRAIGEVRRGTDGFIVSTAEGFLGDDEETWGKRAEYAKRAMAQTRAISRACRSAFAHVVVMMNAGLETTPAEEVPAEGFHNVQARAKPVARPAQQPAVVREQSTGDAQTVRGEVEVAGFKSGAKNGKPWKKLGVKLGGAWYSTFDNKVEAPAKGDSIEITYKQDGEFLTLLSWCFVQDSPPAPTPAEEAAADDGTDNIPF